MVDISKKKLFLYSLITVVGFFVLVEGGLRFLNIANPLLDSYDPLLGYEESSPLYIENEKGSGLLQKNPQYQELREVTFRKTKPDNTYRVYFLGGSNINYFNENDLKTIINNDNNCPPGINFELINAGIPGYGSRRVLRVFDQISHYQPDMLVVYMGHNEFLDLLISRQVLRPKSMFETFRQKALYKLHLYILLKQFYRSTMKPQLSMTAEEVERSLITDHHQVVDAEDLRIEDLPSEIYKQYYQNLKRLIQRAKRQGIYTILLTLPYNDFMSPVYTYYPEGLSRKQVSKMQQYEREGDEILGARINYLKDGGWFCSQLYVHKQNEETFDLILKLFYRRLALSEGAKEYLNRVKPYDLNSKKERGIWEKALKKYEAAHHINENVSMINYKIGIVHFILGDNQQAKKHFDASARTDGSPFRANHIINDIIRRVAREEKPDTFIDFEKMQRDKAPDNLIGWETVYDHCHLDLGSRQELGNILKKIILKQAATNEPLLRGSH
jgi:lysophospholipase L1-like esterase